MSRALAGFAFAVAAALLSACFNPHYASPGFFCSSDVSKGQGCPPGQVCVGSQCTDKNATAGVDLASTSDLASDLAGHDLASEPSDLLTPHDLSSPGDLTMCVAKGGDCTYHNDSVCCSNYCIYSSNTCK